MILIDSLISTNLSTRNLERAMLFKITILDTITILVTRFKLIWPPTLHLLLTQLLPQPKLAPQSLAARHE